MGAIKFFFYFVVVVCCNYLQTKIYINVYWLNKDMKVKKGGNSFYSKGQHTKHKVLQGTIYYLNTKNVRVGLNACIVLPNIDENNNKIVDHFKKR